MKPLFIVLYSVAFVGCSLGQPVVETSPKKYAALMTDWTPTGLVSHFPNPLPSTASKLKLSAFPGYMQSGAWFQIRLTLPVDDVSQVYDDAVKTAKDFYDGGDFYKSTNSKKGAFPEPPFTLQTTTSRATFQRTTECLCLPLNRPAATGGTTASRTAWSLASNATKSFTSPRTGRI